MPIVTIKIAKGRSKEIKRNLVASVTDTIAKTLEVEAQHISVLIEEFDRENWSTGGKLHIDKYGEGFGEK